MVAKIKVQVWMKRIACFFSKASGGFEMAKAEVASGVSSTMVADRKRATRPVVDKKAALYQAIKSTNIKNERPR